MRHGKKIHRLGRPADQRKALLRALTTQLLEHGAIKTTKVKARAVRPWVDKMILLAKDGSEAKRIQAAAWLYDLAVVKNIFELAKERYPTRNSDFTKMEDTYATSDGKGGGAHYLRRGDSAQMVLLTLV